MSQPCTVNSPLFQCRLFCSPHSGRRSSLACVTLCQSPTEPDHTSGGRCQEWRVTTDDLPSSESDTPPPSIVKIVSSPFQRRSTCPVNGSICETALPPS